MKNFVMLKKNILLAAVTTVNFADFKKFKKDNNSITFYFRGLRRFYINWDCFNNSELVSGSMYLAKRGK